MNSTLKHIGIFLGLMVLQTLILNQVNIAGWINPYVFPLFILLLAFDVKPWLLLLIGFFMGLSIDLFNGTLGMHAFATTFMAFVRPYFISNFQSKNDMFSFPSLGHNGFSWMFTYVTSMLAIHHFLYFFIEAGTLAGFFSTFLLFFMSLVFSVFISFLLLYSFKQTT